MNAKKLLALVVGVLTAWAIGGYAVAQDNPAKELTITNTVIVVPTTDTVDGQPVHIKEDAVSAAWLAIELYGKSIDVIEKEISQVKYAEHGSFEYTDQDLIFVLTKNDMPDLPYDTVLSPDAAYNGSYYIALNESAVFANLTAKEPYVELEDKAIQITFSEDDAPFFPNMSEYKVVTLTDDNGNDIMYLYKDVESQDPEAVELGGTLEVGDWKFIFTDIDIDTQKALIHVEAPNGEDKMKIIYKDKPLIVYYDENGILTYYEAANTTDAQAKYDELWNAGIKEFVSIELDTAFIGINGYKYVYVNTKHDTLEKTYKDGDVYKDQWVLDIMYPNPDQVTLWLKVDPDNGLPEIKLKDGDELALPLDKTIVFRPVFEYDEDGTVTGWKYKWVWKEPIEFSFTYNDYVIPVIDPHDVIVEDTSLNALPADKNVIIIGGWVSNKFWSVLEAELGAEKVEEIKADVLAENDSTPGYALWFIENPKDPDHYIIVAAGVDYTKTREAVEQLMKMLDE